MEMKPTRRGWALALTVIATLAVGLVAAPADLRATGTAAELSSPFARLVPTAAAASRKMADAVRPDTTFPVRGAFNWGQGEARFGTGRSGHSHEGQDVFARTGTPLVAAADAKVLETGDDGGRSNYLVLYDASRRRSFVYMHMNRPPRVHRGQRVKAGTRVGEVGCTGSCFGDHLHFEVRAGRGAQAPAHDPLSLLRRWAAAGHLRPTLPPGAH
jgi:murein DD-endopeptidase MepM/ murein hydrolase activator NlpD